MIDALLFAVRDMLRSPFFGYDERTCDIRASGQPPASIGNYFVAVHQTGSSSEMDNALDEYLGFDLTLSYKIKVALDRLGDQELASRLARQPGPGGQPSLNARLDLLRSSLHMCWGLLQDANNFLVRVTTGQVDQVAGFCEPARYLGEELPRFESGAWFFADPAADNVALVGVLHFGRCRRLQPLQIFT